MKENKPRMGDNRTGTARARELCEEMLSGNVEFAPQPQLDGHSIATLREQYAASGGRLGSVPPPASAKQVGKSAMAAIKGENPLLFVDKLGARLAFERNGVRLYEALLSKLDAFGSYDGGPTRESVMEILEEEQRHFHLLRTALETLGADPTAETPAADVEATLGTGIRGVLVDPRSDLAQSLEAILVAELTDNDAWDGLVELATKAGEDELGAKFVEAREREREHLAKVRRWLAAHREAA